MSDDSDKDNDKDDNKSEKNKKRITRLDGSKCASSTTGRPDGKNYHCPKCGRYFYTADERNNHGCSIIEYKNDN